MGIGIGDPKCGAVQVLDEIDSRAFHELEADGIDDQFDAIGLGDFVIAFSLRSKFELVGEARAAATVDREAQDSWLLLPLGDPCDALRRIRSLDGA